MTIRNRILLATLLGAGAITSIQTPAFARDHHRYERRYHRDYRDHRERRYDCRTSGTTGLLLGGAAGALVGRGIDTRGDRTTGTVLGAAGGALLGREIDRNHRC